MTSDTRKPIATTAAAPNTTWRNVIHIHRVRAVTSAPANAMMAPPRGATTMAPMIDATESW